MGCNTSADAKAAKEETGANGAQEKTEKNNQNHIAMPATGKDDKSPTEEEAATKIQAAFRGHQTRKSISMKTSKPQQQQQQEPEPTQAELEAEFRADDKGIYNIS
ncbi:uncharacterized protein LOC125236907 [Leguminivora glycinivorella]|uniref:uncharacterized protein LOC125236907 n=1 Tax=Leguminivora glycinivorella TaxID=1035111 RepID=UPI00200CDC66|nr:uncharacterized protein LOC125236907 [Leguminivora glycinivorella]